MKKEETRFSIRFNPADPRHQFAMDALNTAGRRKATLIADALYHYFVQIDGAETAATLPKNTTSMDGLTAGENNNPSDDEKRQTVLGGLNAFMK
jgi:hypothetical protein